jgi:hypothetical protein
MASEQHEQNADSTLQSSTGRRPGPERGGCFGSSGSTGAWRSSPTRQGWSRASSCHRQQPTGRLSHADARDRVRSSKPLCAQKPGYLRRDFASLRPARRPEALSSSSGLEARQTDGKGVVSNRTGGAKGDARRGREAGRLRAPLCRSRPGWTEGSSRTKGFVRRAPKEVGQRSKQTSDPRCQSPEIVEGSVMRLEPSWLRP